MVLERKLVLDNVPIRIAAQENLQIADLDRIGDRQLLLAYKKEGIKFEIERVSNYKANVYAYFQKP